MWWCVHRLEVRRSCIVGDTTVAGAAIVDSIGNAKNGTVFAFTTNQLDDPRTTNIQRHHTQLIVVFAHPL
jgi:hypothetical protein